MQTENTTKYRTNDLRKIFFRCVKEVNKIERPAKKCYRQSHYQLAFRDRHLKVESVGGRAALNGSLMYIIIPDHWDEEELSLDKREKIARTIVHEYYHNLGYMNFDRNNYKYDTSKTWNVDWVSNYPVRLKNMKPKLKVDLQSVRYGRAKASLEKAETRLKRARTIFNKWKRKVNYYEKVLAKRKAS